MAVATLFCTLVTGSALAGSEVKYDAELTGLTYQLPVSHYQLESQGQTLSMAYSFIEPSEGMPVVTLLHGKNFNGDYWAPTARFLEKRGYGVLVPDQIGFGKSSKPLGYQFSFSVLAGNTRALMKVLGIESSIVFGHSMGGMLATRFALQYPQVVDELVLINPIGLEPYHLLSEYKDVDFHFANEMRKTAAGIQKYQQTFYYDGQWSEAYAKLTEFAVGQINGPDWERVARVNAQTTDIIFTQPVFAEFPALSVPTSLVIGTRDRTAPGRGWKREGVDIEMGRYDQLGKLTAARIPNAKLYEMEGLGHMPQVEDFDQYSEIISQILANLQSRKG
ncbi:Pimeloyl-ACP methyl ester carboxylesterase [Ferrimonas marina]|uniref:Pimeloyl-ACP methyl ester carboxylesterase n=2 Tax=Ferrimonas marina TaxID=299255 RepID=A0A1M5RTV6_9GAMM|nr:Pimeloyl-ACP methyl ester carboxylesterase [Ferrimonas marina]